MWALNRCGFCWDNDDEDDYNDDDSSLRSYVNNVRTKDGGTHEIGLRSAMTKAFNAYAEESGLLAKNKIKSKW